MTITDGAATAAKRAKKQPFRRFSARYLEPVAITVMLLGIFLLCQPWIAVLHQWSLLIMLGGLIAFNVAVHTPPPDVAEPPDDDFGTVSEAIKEMTNG